MADNPAEDPPTDHGDEPGLEPGGALGVWFAFFNEVGILHQLSRTLFEARLPDGVTLPHFTVLNHLIRVRDGQTPRALADAFQVPKTSMTHTLAGLEARGLIAMRANPEDGRSKQVWLTEEGRTFRNDAIRLLAADVEKIASTIDTERVGAALPLLAEVRRYLDENR